MAENHITQVAEVRSLEPFEDAEIHLFAAPVDGLITNVAYTPSEDVHGAYYTRQLQLYVEPKADDRGYRRVVSNIQLGTTEVLLPGRESHNAHLHFPPNSLWVNEGDSLLWSSIGSVGEGLAVPSGTVEIAFEQKQISEELAPPELWVECIPNYWIGKKVWIEYADKNIHELEERGGSFSVHEDEYVGTFEGVDTEILNLALDPIEHGKLPRKTGFPWEQVIQMKLVEGA